jgi:uncharacterized repeat protein (TIGR04138 family)
MTKLDFGEAVDLILNEDPRYSREAYYFLRDALDYTLKQRKKAKEGSGHVTGQQLLEGVRQYALKEFGPMVPTVLDYWRVKRCEDFGEMVFSLIGVGIFGKTDQDSKDDFRGIYTFHDAFVAPFLPEPPIEPRRLSSPETAAELH